METEVELKIQMRIMVRRVPAERQGELAAEVRKLVIDQLGPLWEDGGRTVWPGDYSKNALGYISELEVTDG